MDKEQIERALIEIGTYECRSCPPHHEIAAEFAASEVARSRREIAAELRSYWEQESSDSVLARRVIGLIEKLEGDKQPDNSASIGGNQREGGR